MERAVADRVIEITIAHPFVTLDLTGGAPELNPNFRRLVEGVRREKPELEIIVRSNLTVLYEPGQETLADFYRDCRVHVIASLPCYLEDNVDMIRGAGVYKKSVRALRKLNSLGYGIDDDYVLDLVYSPAGPALPPDRKELEADYKREYRARHAVEFNKLLTMTNMPIARFKKFLMKESRLDSYMQLLVDNFNASTLEALMCRHLISLGYDGSLYDCDFNQALGIKANHSAPDHIDKFDYQSLMQREISCDDHCYGCTAGAGSSCRGSLSG